MNASRDSIPTSLRSTAQRTASVVPGEMSVREGVLEVPGEIALHHGERLDGVHVAWRVEGPGSAPVVCALGGISAHRRVCGTEPEAGWWREIAGPGLPIDTTAVRVLSFDYLGGSGDTTGPQAGERFPSISTYDQAELLVRLLNHLGIKSLRAIVGGSYGGMVALAFAERYPERVSRVVVIGASDRPSALATAWRSAQRQIVRFALDCGRGAEGLTIARGLAMSTYRSREELAARFSGPPSRRDGRFTFPIEQYLNARGSDYASRYLPESFLCLSESIDLHRVDAARICVPATIIAIREDQLVPLEDIRRLAARLPAARLYEISSIYGHDAFLKETDQLRNPFAAALRSPA